MGYSYCTYIKNLCSRLTYTIIIAILLSVMAIFVADTFLVTLDFSPTSFEKDSQSVTFISITKPIQMETYFFAFPLPGKFQIATTLNGQQCMTFYQNQTVSIGDLKPTVHFAVNPMNTSTHLITCIEGTSYENLTKNFLFDKFNLTIIICVAIFSSIMVGLLISIWLCCDGWCGCKCFKIFTLCCDDIKITKTEKKEMVKDFQYV